MTSRHFTSIARLGRFMQSAMKGSKYTRSADSFGVSILSIFVIFGMPQLATTAPAKAAVRSEQVTIEDLQGATIEASTTDERVVRQKGKNYPGKFQMDLNIRFIDTNSIHVNFVGTWYGARQTRQTKNEGGVANLEHPKEVKSRGGGHSLWTFQDGVLSYLRTYQGGGMIMTFAMNRSAKGFECAAKMSKPRETGIPSINMKSVVAGGWVEILSSKMVRSSCSIRAAN
jgi:hypothetical protein